MTNIVLIFNATNKVVIITHVSMYYCVIKFCVIFSISYEVLKLFSVILYLYLSLYELNPM